MGNKTCEGFTVNSPAFFTFTTTESKMYLHYINKKNKLLSPLQKIQIQYSDR